MRRAGSDASLDAPVRRPSNISENEPTSPKEVNDSAPKRSQLSRQSSSYSQNSGQSKDTKPSTVMKKLGSSIEHLMNMTESHSEKQQKQSRLNCLASLSDVLISNISNYILTLLDFILLLHCVQVKSTGDSQPDGIAAVLWCLLALFALISMYRLFFKLRPRSDDELVDNELGITPILDKHRYDLELWEVFDMFLLLFSLIGACVEGLWSSVSILPRVLRALRFLAVDKLGLKYNKGLFPFRAVLHVMVKTATSFFFSIVVLALQMLVFAAFGMELVQVKVDDVDADRITEKFGREIAEQCFDAFSTLVLSLSTLFSLASGNQWDSVALPIISVKPWTLIFFMSHVLLASVLVVGTVYAHLNHFLADWRSQQVTLEDERLMSDKAAAICRLEELFVAMDNNKDGLLTWDEFYYNRQNNPECQRICNKLDISDGNLQWLWSVLDINQDGRVSQQEFLDLMWRVQSKETKWTLIQNGHQMKQIYERVLQQNKNTEQGFAMLHGELQKLQMQQSMPASPGGKSESAISLATFHDVDAPIPAEGEAQKAEETASNVEYATEPARLSMALDNLRGVKADRVAYYSRTEVVDFWGSGSFFDTGINKEFQMSQACRQCDFFVSHCWTGPEDWHNYFRRNDVLETYEYKKAMVVHHILTEGVGAKKGEAIHLVKSISGSQIMNHMPSGERRSNRGFHSQKSIAEDPVSKIILWIDKCCIPQSDKQKKALCVKLIEQFMQLSRGFIVILSWNYFTRLWCVYEWACYFRLHSLSDLRIFVGCDAFLRSSPEDTLPLYLASIENLSVRGSKCMNQSDHEILEEKVYHYYEGKSREESFASFERFSKCTAISFLGKQIVRFRARGSPEDQSAWLNPILLSTKRLGYWDLYKALSLAEPARWFQMVDKDQESFDLIVEFWFQRIIVKYLSVERKAAVRPNCLHQDSKAELQRADEMRHRLSSLLRDSGQMGSLSDLFQWKDSGMNLSSFGSFDEEEMFTTVVPQPSVTGSDGRSVGSVKYASL